VPVTEASANVLGEVEGGAVQHGVAGLMAEQANEMATCDLPVPGGPGSGCRCGQRRSGVARSRMRGLGIRGVEGPVEDVEGLDLGQLRLLGAALEEQLAGTGLPIAIAQAARPRAAPAHPLSWDEIGHTRPPVRWNVFDDFAAWPGATSAVSTPRSRPAAAAAPPPYESLGSQSRTPLPIRHDLPATGQGGGHEPRRAQPEDSIGRGCPQGPSLRALRRRLADPGRQYTWAPDPLRSPSRCGIVTGLTVGRCVAVRSRCPRTPALHNGSRHEGRGMEHDATGRADHGTLVSGRVAPPYRMSADRDRSSSGLRGLNRLHFLRSWTLRLDPTGLPSRQGGRRCRS
jgi:hypothetical protein